MPMREASRAERLDEPLDVARSDLDDEPADRFAEQRDHRVVVGKRIDRGAEAAADAHLGERHCQPALADVVARAHDPGADGVVEPPVPSRCVRIRRRRTARSVRLAVDHVEVRAGELVPCGADLEQDVADVVEVGRDTSVGVGHVGHGGDHQRRWDGVTLTVVADVLVVERVLAGDERRTVDLGRRAAAVDRGDEVAERRLAPRVTPREVVEQGHPAGIGADGDDVADRFVDDGDRHRFGVVEAVPRVHPDADGEALGRCVVGDHDAVGGGVGGDAHQRAHDGGTEDLVVVPPDDVLVRGDVRVGEDRQERGDRIIDAAGRSRRPVGTGADRGHLPLRARVVEERGVEIGDHRGRRRGRRAARSR